MSEYFGCSDGGCVFGHPGGMHTNGGCRCLAELPPEKRVRVRNGIRQMREALEEISDPIAVLKKRAEEEGLVLDVRTALWLAGNAENLKSIARRGLGKR